MNRTGHTWVLVLAAGEGRRLRSLTTTRDGTTVPKQFCSLRGGASLLQDSLKRALTVARASRICAIVAAKHRRWWAPELDALPPVNRIVQPGDRGTGLGVLLPLLHIALRDPNATLLIIPSDHFVRDEWVLAASFQELIRLAHRRPEALFLLGTKPNLPDTELGYILPSGTDLDGASQVRTFVEKPSRPHAEALLKGGALWNLFILAAKVQTLLALYVEISAEVVRKLGAAIKVDRGAVDWGASVAQAYRTLPVLDFSHDVLQGKEEMLRVVAVPYCGWTDLGTPHRVAETLRLVPDAIFHHAWTGAASCLNLSEQQARLQAATAPRAAL